MNLPHRQRWIAWFAACLLLACLATATLAPHFKRGAGDFAVLCTAGGMRLVKLDNSAQVPATSHSLDCPACLGSLAAPPAPAVLGTAHVFRFAAPAAPAAHFERRATLTACARGPPVTA